jgi:hypothetical protein
VPKLRHRRYAPLNFKSRPVWYYRFRPSKILERQAWRRSDDSPLWRNLALTFVALRTIRGFVGRQPETVAFERLRPGDRLTVVPVSQRTRAERKAAKRWTPGR